MAKAKRKGRIFVDYLRNERGSTAIAPYSTRSRDGAPVAAPITWEEVKTVTGANISLSSTCRDACGRSATRGRAISRCASRSRRLCESRECRVMEDKPLRRSIPTDTRCSSTLMARSSILR